MNLYYPFCRQLGLAKSVFSQYEGSMALHGIVHLARQTAQRHLEPGDIAIDATVGAGYDTVCLARAVGESGHVYGFDIQPAAIRATHERLAAEKLSPRATLFEAGHQQMLELLPDELAGSIKVCTFNLGFLPSGDQAITTRAETSIMAIQSALKLMHPRGIISIAIYSGHAQGAREQDQIKAWARSISYEEYRIACYEFINKTANQESLLLIEKV